jgi:hypothetical protein
MRRSMGIRRSRAARSGTTVPAYRFAHAGYLLPFKYYGATGNAQEYGYKEEEHFISVIPAQRSERRDPTLRACRR